MPKISVVIPVFNGVKYFNECMDSVVNQTLKDLEIIVVDAGSTDGTLELLKEYVSRDKRIRVINSDKKCVGHQYNLGIAAAQGEFIGFVEADDYIVSNMYEILLEYALKYDLDWVKGNYFYLMDYPVVGRQLMPVNDQKFCPTSYVFNPGHYPKQYVQEIFMWRGIYNTKFVRDNKIVLNETGGASFQDIGFVLQAYMYAEKALYINDYLYCYRRDNQNSSSHQPNTMLFEINQVEYISGIIKSNSRVYQTFWNVNYIRAMKRFLSAYERVPPISQSPDEVQRAVNRYRDYLMAEMDINGLFWETSDVADEFRESVWLREGTERFDAEYRRVVVQDEKLLRNMVHKILNQRKVIIFGCGDNGTGIVSLLLRHQRPEIICLSDNDENKWNQKYMGLNVIPPQELPLDEECIVLVANRSHYYEIKAQLMEHGMAATQIWLAPLILRFRGTNLLLENEILPLR